jgi:hypothetical protein
MMNNRRMIVLLTMSALALVVLLLAATGAWAGPDERGPAAPLAPAAVVSDTISYQGRLLDSSGSPVDGTTVMTFTLYADPNDMTPLWSQISSVPVEDGLFNVNLAVDPAHFDGRALWLGVWVEGDAQEMTPRQPLLAAPYALSLRPGAAISGTIDGVPTLNIVSDGIGIHVETTSSTDPRDPALVGVNLGDGPGLEGHGANGFGVIGLSIGKPGVFGGSINGTAGVFTSTYSYGVVVDGAGLDGLRIFDRVGRDYISAGSDADPDFRVDDTGTVYADGSFNCGLGSGCFNTGIGADVAERIDVSETLEPGDVVEIDPDNPRHFRLSCTAYSTLVAGVVSTDPAITMNNNDLADNAAGERTDDRPLLALVGQVPVKASVENGPIAPGDLLVASATPGHAMKAGPNPPVGAVIGKALEDLDAGTGVIQMLVTLQ